MGSVDKRRSAPVDVRWMGGAVERNELNFTSM